MLYDSGAGVESRLLLNRLAGACQIFPIQFPKRACQASDVLSMAVESRCQSESMAAAHQDEALLRWVVQSVLHVRVALPGEAKVHIQAQAELLIELIGELLEDQSLISLVNTVHTAEVYHWVPGGLKNSRFEAVQRGEAGSI